MSDVNDFLLLDQQLCFAAYSTANAFGRAYKPLLDPLGLTYPQYLVMLVLWEQDPRMLSGIGEKLQLDSSTLTPVLKRMEQAGFVRRERSQEDERVLLISLTEQGRALREKAKALPAAMRCAIGGTPDDVEALRRSLMKVRQALEPLMKG